MTDKKLRTLTATGLRTRFSPKSRVGQGLVSMAPWVDIILLFLVFLFIDGKFVLQPGAVIELEEAEFVGGLRAGAMLVVTSVKASPKGARDEMVFFDDVRFLVAQEEQMENLQKAFRGTVIKRPETDLTIHADKQVEHGTIMKLLGMAKRAGIKRVNLASRQRRPGAAGTGAGVNTERDSRE
ncbi:ExbD/TolR family protein [Verrucomicrobiota bacterium]